MFYLMNGNACRTQCREDSPRARRRLTIRRTLGLMGAIPCGGHEHRDHEHAATVMMCVQCACLSVRACMCVRARVCVHECISSLSLALYVCWVVCVTVKLACGG